MNGYRRELLLGRDYMKELNYLQSNENAWINTDFVPTGNTMFSCKFQFMEIKAQARVFGTGSRKDTSGVIDTVLYINGSKKFAFTRSHGNWSSWNISADTNVHTFKTTSNTKAWLDSTALTNKVGSGDSPKLALFNYFINGSSKWRCTVRIFNFTCTEDGETVLDLIPVLDMKGRPCMYDKVSRKKYYNSGSVDFLYG